jgi:hypothetical protein
VLAVFIFGSNLFFLSQFFKHWHSIPLSKRVPHSPSSLRWPVQPWASAGEPQASVAPLGF